MCSKASTLAFSNCFPFRGDAYPCIWKDVAFPDILPFRSRAPNPAILTSILHLAHGVNFCRCHHNREPLHLASWQEPGRVGAQQVLCGVLMMRRELNRRHWAPGWPSTSKVDSSGWKHLDALKALGGGSLKVLISSQMQTSGVCNLGLFFHASQILPTSAHCPILKPLPNL